MRGPAVLVGLGVELHAEPRRVAADALADRGGVLADAAGEDERVEPAERGGERAQLAPDAVDDTGRPRACARGSSLASSVRMSLETPDTPSSPDSW